MNPPSVAKSLREKAASVAVLSFMQAAADQENASISRSYRSAPSCILLSPFPSLLWDSPLTGLPTHQTPPINPIWDLQKTGPGSPVQNRKVTGRETTERPCAARGGCSRLLPPSSAESRGSFKKQQGAAEGHSVSSQSEYRSSSGSQPGSHGQHPIKPEIASLVPAQVEKGTCMSSPQLGSWS